MNDKENDDVIEELKNRVRQLEEKESDLVQRVQQLEAFRNKFPKGDNPLDMGSFWDKK